MDRVPEDTIDDDDRSPRPHIMLHSDIGLAILLHAVSWAFIFAVAVKREFRLLMSSDLGALGA